MSYVLIQLDEDPNASVSTEELYLSGFLPAIFETAQEDRGAANHVLQALEMDGAKIYNLEEGTRITFTETCRERYFRHYWYEFQRWMEQASKMDFADFKTWHGEIKFNDAERHFRHPNDIYVWYAGWYASLTEFMREIKDGESFYVGTAFTLR